MENHRDAMWRLARSKPSPADYAGLTVGAAASSVVYLVVVLLLRREDCVANTAVIRRNHAAWKDVIHGLIYGGCAASTVGIAGAVWRDATKLPKQAGYVWPMEGVLHRAKQKYNDAK